MSRLLGAFAIIALVLGAVGVYGVMAYSVAQRTQEIGVRIALGARATDVFRLVLGHGLFLATVGLVAGLVTAFGLSRLLSSVLFGISPSDPPTYAAIALMLGFVALLACYIPARSATRVDPLDALRAD